MANAKISVRLDEETQRLLDQETRGTGRSGSEVVRDALKAYLKDKSGEPTCLELARRHRLLSRGKRLPRDLSTNRKHMEGFGR
jgi:Arc/MetJ-type ribon-helix-helix transcriptional regulator